MNLRNRLDKIERLLEDMDNTHPEFEALNQEADDIQTQINEAEDAFTRDQAKRIYERKLSEAKSRVAKSHPDFSSYEDWYQFTKSQYEVDDNYKITSKAREWSDDNPKEWVCGNELEVIEKIEQLMNWREYDHFQRNKP